MKIRIGTWNIAAGRKIRSLEWMDYSDEDIEYFYDQLKELDLDVICLQESQFNSEESFAQELATKLGYQTVLETLGCPSHIDKKFNMSPVIISRLDATGSDSFILPYPEFRLIKDNTVFPPYDRNVLKVTFGTFSVVTTHPEPVGMFGASYEIGNGKKLATDIDELLLSRLEQPMILAADMNMENLPDALPKTMHTYSLKDVFLDQSTKPHGGHPDHIAYSSDLTLINSGIVNTMTDHYLCWAEFDFQS